MDWSFVFLWFTVGLASWLVSAAHQWFAANRIVWGHIFLLPLAVLCGFVSLFVAAVLFIGELFEDGAFSKTAFVRVPKDKGDD